VLYAVTAATTSAVVDHLAAIHPAGAWLPAGGGCTPAVSSGSWYRAAYLCAAIMQPATMQVPATMLGGGVGSMQHVPRQPCAFPCVRRSAHTCQPLYC
jgi:hypothetical protein